MQNKIKYLCLSAIFGALPFVAFGAPVEEVFIEDSSEELTGPEQQILGIAADQDELSAAAVNDYQVEGSLFDQITNLEQEKVLMQLEKERAQLDLELDRLAAEKIKLHMEIDTLSGRAEQQQQEIETERAKLEAEAARLERQKQALEDETVAAAARAETRVIEQDVSDILFSDQYRLINVVGAGSQLQATIEDLTTGQTRKLTVGKALDGYTVKSISLDEGVVFVNADGNTQNLNVGGAQ